MASSINASTSGAGGVITTADNSGVLNLQSGGTTVATVSSTGFSTPANQTINTANTFGFKNRIINGGMAVSQYNGTSSVTGTSLGYFIDRFTMIAGSGTFTAQQSSTTVPAGFAYSTGITVTSAGTRNATDYAFLYQTIEGYSVADLGFGTANAKTVTLSFWVNSSVTGTYSGVFASGDNTQTYGFTYSIPVANTWTYITTTVAGQTSGGTTAYPINNTAGFRVKFDLGSGSNYQVTAGSWQAATNKVGVAGTASWAQTLGATFYITGVQLEVGSQATSFDFRDYGRELQMCQRYFYKPDIATTRFYGCVYGSSGFVNIPMPVTMRVAPTSTQTVNATLYAAYNNPVMCQLNVASGSPDCTAFTASAEL